MQNKNSQFLNAVYNGDVETVEILLQEQSVNPATQHNEALRFAAENGHTEVVKVLLQDSRVDPTANNNAAIRKAAENGLTEIVRVLLQDSRVDPSADDNAAIVLASRNGHTEIVRLLLQNDRVDPTVNDNYAIRYAASIGYAEIVKLLLQSDRVDPAADNNYAIKIAARNGHTEVVKLLLQDDRISSDARDFTIRNVALGGKNNIVKLMIQDNRTDWRKVYNIPFVKRVIINTKKELDRDIEKKLAQSYLSITQAGPTTWVGTEKEGKEVSLIQKDIRRKISEKGVYEPFYDEYCSSIPKDLKIPPIKLILIANKLDIEYDMMNINWTELCAKVRLRLDHILDL